MTPLDLSGRARDLLTDERFGSEAQTPSDAGQRPKLLKDQRDKLIGRRVQLAWLRTVWMIVAATVLLCAPVLLIWGQPKLAATVGAYGGLFLLFFLMTRARMRELGEEIDQRDNELDLLTIEKGSEERRAQKLFQLHSRQLKQYYDQALRQGSSVYWVGLLCILLGFGVIGITFWLIRDAALGATSEKIIVGALGAVGGILANFIAVIYLRMHSETMKSNTEFHNRLVLTHHLHFGNFLVAKIEDPPLRDSTLGMIAQTLALSLAKPEADILSQVSVPEPNGTPQTEAVAEKPLPPSANNGHKRSPRLRFSRDGISWSSQTATNGNAAAAGPHVHARDPRG